MSDALDIDDPRTNPLHVAAQAADFLAGTTGVERHDIALVLGSGWSQATDLVGETIAEVPAAEIPGFTAPAVSGHSKTVKSIRAHDGRAILVLGSRTHLYEGRGVRRVAHGMRTAAAAGASTVVLTNGAGSVHTRWPPGTPVLIRDHINLTGVSPLNGATFQDLTDLYSQRLRFVARELSPNMPQGVYVQFRGPHYETPAEVEMAKRIGGDLVGMSTTLEAITARSVGMEVLGLSLVTNLAAGVGTERLSHDDVLQAGQDAAPRISRLLADIVAAIPAN